MRREIFFSKFNQVLVKKFFEDTVIEINKIPVDIANRDISPRNFIFALLTTKFLGEYSGLGVINDGNGAHDAHEDHPVYFHLCICRVLYRNYLYRVGNRNNRFYRRICC